MVKNLSAMQGTWVQSLGWEDPLEKGMTIHSSLSDPEIELASPAMQADSLLSEPPGKLVAGTIVLLKCLVGTCGNGREALMDAARLNLHISLERH